MNLEEFLAVVEPLVLGSLSLALAPLEHQLLFVDAENPRDDLKRRRQAIGGPLRIDAFGRGVLLHMGPQGVALIKIDGQSVLGHVGVVDAVAVDAVAPGPALESAQVLAQTIGEIGCLSAAGVAGGRRR